MTSVGMRNEQTRMDWVQRALKQVPAGSRILDAGAGEQRYRPDCSHLKYVAQDFAQYDGKGNGAGLQMGAWDQSGLDIVSDITRIPEPDGSFDAILCVEVFEHIPSPLLALREFARLLRPGGTLILTAPFCSITHFAPYFFYNGFSRYFYETHLPAHGFRILEMDYNGNYFEYLAQELRRLPAVAKQHAGTRLWGWHQLLVLLMLRLLQRLSRRDRGSSELLHFGCHVRAVKEPQAVEHTPACGRR